MGIVKLKAEGKSHEKPLFGKVFLNAAKGLFTNETNPVVRKQPV
jgi:hypothetical protein